MINNHKCMNLDTNLDQIVNTLTTIIAIRDPYTANHQKHVAEIAVLIANEMCLGEDSTTGLYLAGLLHDIGKLYVPNEILTRPGRIDEFEYGIIRKHCEVGYCILSKIDFPWPINEFIIQHHERIDGSGYPFGLTGEHIYIESKILAVADVVESISSHRPYRPALGMDFALDEIRKNKGILYDVNTVDACIKVYENALVRNMLKIEEK